MSLLLSTQGAFAGLSVSFSYSVWIVVGQFLKGGGSPPTLPLSVDSCPAQVNTTLETLASTTLATTSATFPTAIFDRLEADTSFIEEKKCWSCLPSLVFLISTLLQYLRHPSREEEEKDIYDISYCYVGMIALFITLVVSIMVSLVTGKSWTLRAMPTVMTHTTYINASNSTYSFLYSVHGTCSMSHNFTMKYINSWFL